MIETQQGTSPAIATRHGTSPTIANMNQRRKTMATPTSPAVRQLLAALRTVLVLTVIFGLAYPLAMTGIAQAAFHGNANGSLVHRDGKTVGSDLIGQAFTKPVLVNGKPRKGADGNPVVEPDPAYFQSRPSAAGLGYDPCKSKKNCQRLDSVGPLAFGSHAKGPKKPGDRNEQKQW